MWHAGTKQLCWHVAIEFALGGENEGLPCKPGCRPDSTAVGRCVAATVMVERQRVDANTRIQALLLSIASDEESESVRFLARSVSQGEGAVLLRAFPSEGNTPRYHRCDLRATLADTLKGRCVLEYPDFAVVAKYDPEKYRLPDAQTSELP